LVEINVARVAENGRLRYKRHLDVGIERADVLIEFESIQFESNVDVSTNTSICSPVNSHSRSVCVVDRSRLIFQLISQLTGNIHSWYSTQQLATLGVSFRQFTRLQHTTRKPCCHRETAQCHYKLLSIQTVQSVVSFDTFSGSWHGHAYVLEYTVVAAA